DFEARDRPELLDDAPGGLDLLEAEFGVGVEVVAQCGDRGQQLVNESVNSIHQSNSLASRRTSATRPSLSHIPPFRIERITFPMEPIWPSRLARSSTPSVPV